MMRSTRRSKRPRPTDSKEVASSSGPNKAKKIPTRVSGRNLNNCIEFGIPESICCVAHRQGPHQVAVKLIATSFDLDVSIKALNSSAELMDVTGILFRSLVALCCFSVALCCVVWV
jgi:hypothetical protein